jgi:hypothetical protein
MDNPKVEGDFLSLDALREDLAALLRDEVAGAYLLWMEANARAVADDAPGVSIEIAGHAFTQKPQRYAAKAFTELKRKRAAHYDSAALTALLEETGCEPFLSSPPMESSGADEEEGDDAGDDAED